MRRTDLARRRRGVATVEFALVAMVLFPFIFGLIEFGRLVMVHQAVVNAAREGGRKASLSSTTNENQEVGSVVRDILKRGAIPASVADDPIKATVTVTPSGSLKDVSPGTPITVAVGVDIANVSWLPGNFFGFVNTNISASVTMERGK